MRARHHGHFAVLAALSAGLLGVSLSVTIAACSSSETTSFVVAPDDASDGAASLPPPSNDTSDASADASATPDVVIPPVSETVTCTVNPCATQLAAGAGHYCARMSDGTVRCWGDNSRGQLGFGDIDAGTDAGFSPDGEATPGIVEGLEDVEQIDSVSSTTCAVLKDGAVKCWGDNASGGLGNISGAVNQDMAPHPTPQTVPLPLAAQRVDVFSNSYLQSSVCATLEGGELWCWGANSGEAGLLGRSGSSSLLVARPGIADRLMPYSGLRFRTAGGSFAMTNDQHLIEWGTISGRDTVANNAAIAYPVALQLEGVTAVSSSDSHACAIVQGQVMCWGQSNADVYLCDGTGANQTTKLPALAKTRGIAQPRQLAIGVGSVGTCVRMTDGTVQCCGDNVNGGLATGDTQSSMLFTEAKALEGTVVQIAATQNSKCALLVTGEVKCWGGNKVGELGQGTTDSDPHPVPVAVTLP